MQNFEQRLHRSLFQHIRRGQLQEAIELCNSCKLYWKGACLRGGILHYDPKMDSQIDTMDSQGNQNRTLWKATAFAIACDVIYR